MLGLASFLHAGSSEAGGYVSSNSEHHKFCTLLYRPFAHMPFQSSSRESRFNSSTRIYGVFAFLWAFTYTVNLSVFMLFCSPSCFTAHGNRSCVLNAGSMSAFMRRRAQFETPQCPSCDSTNVVTDNRQGHLVCDDCGVILESSMISTATESVSYTHLTLPTKA